MKGERYGTYILVRGTLVKVASYESGASRNGDLTTSEFSGISGATVRYRAPRPRARITLSYDIARPSEVRALNALVNGEFGSGPVRVIDVWAQRTNVLDRDTSVLTRWAADPMFSSSLRSTDDGQVFGRALVNIPASGVSMTGGTGFYAPAPPAGEKVTVSAYVGAVQGQVAPRWLGADGTTSTGTAGALVTVPGGGVLTRAHVTATVPAAMASGSPVVGVGLVVTGTGATAAGPCVTWSTELLPYMDGQCPLGMVADAPSYDARRMASGPAASASVTFREVGA